MVTATRAGRLIEGFRGSTPGDRDALIDALVNLGRLAQDLGDVIEADRHQPVPGLQARRIRARRAGRAAAAGRSGNPQLTRACGRQLWTMASRSRTMRFASLALSFLSHPCARRSRGSRSRRKASLTSIAARPSPAYIGYGVGGGYDLFARTISRHMSRHIPGNPTILPVNMPGASSMILGNHLAKRAPRDGTAFGAVNSALLFDTLFAGDANRRRSSTAPR